MIVGEVAHIVGERRQGPRGDSDLDEAARNRVENLILLCPTHHTLIDVQPRTYSVSVLRQLKQDHEQSVRQRLAPNETPPPPHLTTERLYSTILSISRLPAVVYAAPCPYGDDEIERVRTLITYPKERDKLVPFILRGKQLFAFSDLSAADGPFAKVAEDRNKVTRCSARDLWVDPDGSRRYVELLNHGIRRFAALKGLRYDREHRRYYFTPRQQGKERSVRYISRQGKKVVRKVVWRPVTLATGEFKKFWWHLAVGIRLHHVGRSSWCLSVRPERSLSTDGSTPVPPEMVGRRVTKLKARMYNDLYLSEVHFWRAYLSDGQPRIILDFEGQSAVVEMDLVPFEVRSPGIPGDSKPYLSHRFQEDLFSLADLQGFVEVDVADEDAIPEIDEDEDVDS